MKTKVAISFDTTGSMSPCIAEVRRKVDSALGKLFGSIENLEISIISHGDYCDGKGMLNCIPFTNNLNDLSRFIKMTPNTSGGDTPEFYEYVLRFAGSLDWGDADNKIFIVIGDDKPHPVGYHYNGVTYNIDWKVEARALADMGVSIYPVKALGYPIAFWDELAMFSNGKKVNLDQFTDSVEVITAVCMHKTGGLEEYRQELESTFHMNRSLAGLFETLGSKVENVKFTRKDTSGLAPVPPSRFQVLHVDEDIPIKLFIEKMGVHYKAGRGFYEITKPELIQEYKEVILENIFTGDKFTGSEARVFLGVPYGIRAMAGPKRSSEYRVFVQSTSYNRKLIHGTLFLYENEYAERY